MKLSNGKRTAALAFLCCVLVPAVAGCAQHSGSAAQAAASSAGAPPVGSVVVAGLVTISSARLVPGPGGTEELLMTVTDTANGPDHLYDVLTSNAAAAELVNAHGATISGTGIELDPDSPVVFGPGGGPRVLLEKPSGLHAGAPVTVSLIFADAGLVRLDVVPAQVPSKVATPDPAGSH
jgi:copper(I)-binding protein